MNVYLYDTFSLQFKKNEKIVSTFSFQKKHELSSIRIVKQCGAKYVATFG